MISIALIEYGSELYQESVDLRQRILRDPIGLKFTGENLATDANEIHIAATDGSSLVGILLLRHINDDVVKMRQVAVDQTQQNKGIGKMLVAFAEDLAKNMGYSTMELNARNYAIPFYTNLDYNVLGDEFTEVGIPHHKMKKELV